MNKTQFIVLVALLAYAGFASQSIQLQCVSVATSICNSGFQWRATGSN